jgi:CBS domain-containing protein
MKTVKFLLDRKQQSVIACKPSDIVMVPLQLMKTHKIRSVLVIENDRLEGIVTQGDCAIKVLLAELDPKTTLVSSIMTPHPIAVSEEYKLDQCLSLMYEKRLRHLPVLRNTEVVGMVSVGDLVTQVVEEQHSKIASLENYIIGHGIPY